MHEHTHTHTRTQRLTFSQGICSTRTAPSHRRCGCHRPRPHLCSRRSPCTNPRSLVAFLHSWCWNGRVCECARFRSLPQLSFGQCREAVGTPSNPLARKNYEFPRRSRDCEQIGPIKTRRTSTVRKPRFTTTVCKSLRQGQWAKMSIFCLFGSDVVIGFVQILGYWAILRSANHFHRGNRPKLRMWCEEPVQSRTSMPRKLKKAAHANGFADQFVLSSV